MMMFVTSYVRREGRVLLKIPRGDINGVGEDEVTVTSWLHAQAERANKQTEKRGLHPVEAQAKIRSQVMLLNHGGQSARKSKVCRPARDQKVRRRLRPRFKV